MSETCVVENSICPRPMSNTSYRHMHLRELYVRELCATDLSIRDICVQDLYARDLCPRLYFFFPVAQKGMHRWSGTSLLEMLSSVAHKRYAPHCLNGLSLCPRTVCPRPLSKTCVSETSVSETSLSKTCVSKTSVCTFPGETGCARPLTENYSHVNGGINDPKRGG